MSGDTVDAGAMAQQWRGTLVELLGIEFAELTKERVVATLAIRDDLRTVGGALHGGTLMAFADTVGAVATAGAGAADPGGRPGTASRRCAKADRPRRW